MSINSSWGENRWTSPVENRNTRIEIGTRQTPTTPATTKELTTTSPDKAEKMKSDWTSLVKGGATIGERMSFINKNFSHEKQATFKNQLSTFTQIDSKIKNNHEKMNKINEELTKLDSENKAESKKLNSFFTKSNAQKKINENNNKMNNLNAELKNLQNANVILYNQKSTLLKCPDFNVQKHCASTLHTPSFAKIDLNKITTSHINLEAVQPHLIANDKVKSAVTCKNPTTTADGTAVSKTGKEDERFGALHGSNPDNEFPNNAGGSAMNTYNGIKIDRDGNKKENLDGQQFCDAFHFENHSQYKLLVLADGSGHGDASQNAAQTSVAGAVKFVNEALQNPNSVKNGNDIRDILFSGVEAAQQEIYREPVYNENGEITGYKQKDLLRDPPGSTTFNMCFEYQGTDGTTYLNSFSVGDSATFVLTRDPSGQNNIINLSVGSRNNDPLDMQEPGGQLGKPHQNEFDPETHKITFNVDPDLSNISFNAIAIPKDTSYLVLTMSDGVTDNLNPFNLGLSVAEAQAYINETPMESGKTWQELPPSKAAQIINDFQTKKMQELVLNAERKLGNDATPQAIMTEITGYCKGITENRRNILNQAPISKEYPGKLDHVSVVGFGNRYVRTSDGG